MGENRDTDKNGRRNEEGDNDQFEKVFHVENIPHNFFSFNYFRRILYGAIALSDNVDARSGNFHFSTVLIDNEETVFGHFLNDSPLDTVNHHFHSNCDFVFVLHI